VRFAFPVAALIVFMVDLPTLIVRFCVAQPFGAAVIVLLVLVLWLAFAPVPSDRRWN
jgi:hypothetical protein